MKPLYNIIKTQDGLWKLEETGLDEKNKNEPYLKHIKLSGDINKLKKLKQELESKWIQHQKR